MERKQVQRLSLTELRERRETRRQERAQALGITVRRVSLPPKHVAPQLPVPLPAGARIGVHRGTGEPVYINAPDLEGGMAIIGRPRKGKTVTMLHMAAHYVAEGYPVIVLDPHEDFVNDLLLRVPDRCIDNIALLDATNDTYPFGINPFYCPDPTNDELVARLGDQVHEVFRKASGDAWGAVLDDLIPNAAYTLLYNPGHSILDLPRLFSDREFRSELVSRVRNEQVREAWENEYDRKSDAAQRTMIQSSVVRIRKFTRNPILQGILGQGTPTVDFATLIRERKSIFVKLSIRKLGSENTALLGGLVLQQIMAGALEQLTLARSERRQIILFCDEFQLFATESFAEIIEQLGKVGLTVVLAHQNYDQISRDVLRAPRNATSHIAFQIGNKDASEKVEEFDAEPPEVEQVVHPDPFNFLLRNGHPNMEIMNTVRRLEERLNDAIDENDRDLARHYKMPQVRRAERDHLKREADKIRRYLSTFLSVSMSNVSPGDKAEAHAELFRVVHGFFTYVTGEAFSTDCELFMGSVGYLEQWLNRPGNRIYSTASQFDKTLTPGQAKELLRRELTRLPRLHAIAKLQRNGEAVELPVLIDPPPDIERTPDVEAKLERLAQLMIEQGYVHARRTVSVTPDEESGEPILRPKGTQRARRDEL